jgi:hypothetical protein
LDAPATPALDIHRIASGTQRNVRFAQGLANHSGERATGPEGFEVDDAERIANRELRTGVQCVVGSLDGYLEAQTLAE